MKSATEILNEHGINLGELNDDFNTQLLHAMERYAEAYNANQVGELSEGEHPDEIKPRAETWLKERANWQSEVESLRNHISTLQSLKQ